MYKTKNKQKVNPEDSNFSTEIEKCIQKAQEQKKALEKITKSFSFVS